MNQRFNQSVPSGKVALSGVPETMLWPLWNRAAETKRGNHLVDDPMAVELVDRIDYDFAGRFGRPTIFHPIRARYCDDLIRNYVAREENPVVVALGEGLDAQYWRIGTANLTWLSVDLPEAIETRNAWLPAHRFMTSVPCSALDLAWMDAVPPSSRPFVTMAGLLMYFEEQDVRRLLTEIAARFPGAEIFFDTITPHVSRKTLTGMKVTKRYAAPPMPWGVTIDDLPNFVASIPGLETVSIRSYADSFPDRTRLYRLLSRFGPMRRRYAGGLVYLRSVPMPGTSERARSRNAR